MNAPKTLTLTLSHQAMETVLGGVAQLPFHVAKPIMDEAEKQMSEQLQAQQAQAAQASQAAGAPQA